MRSSQESAANPLLLALQKHQVTAEVTDCDYNRIHGGFAVETDYIVTVRPLMDKSKPGSKKDSSDPNEDVPPFETFLMSKTFRAFRAFAQKLHDVTEAHDLVRLKYEEVQGSIPPESWKIAKYCQLVYHLIDSQPREYLGKVTLTFVKVLSKERKQVLDDALEATVRYFPSADAMERNAYVREIAQVVENFFLTDHCTEVHSQDNAASRPSLGSKVDSTASVGKIWKKVTFEANPLHWVGSKSSSRNVSAKKQQSRRGSEIIVPLSTRARRSDDKGLNQFDDEARLTLNAGQSTSEYQPSYAKSAAPVISSNTSWVNWLDNNPLVFLVISAAAVPILYRAATMQVRLDGDVELLVVFAAFCLGLHIPRPAVGSFDRSTTSMVVEETIAPRQEDLSGRKLLRRSMMRASTVRRRASSMVQSGGSPRANEPLIPDVIEEEEEEIWGMIGSPMARGPDGAPVGSLSNCWTYPEAAGFEVRGAKYLVDHKKVSSGDYLFPCRGMDLFLTDTCPDNVGKNPLIYGGRMREVPTFVVNFLLPWGVLLLYFEIPERFLPFVKAAYSDDVKLPSMDGMPPSERAVCRFLMKDQSHKNQTLKIVPVVVEGPWVVRQVVGGKPAIIGNKVPIKYVYGAEGDGKALYLEADMEVAASSAARGIVSVTRTYTQMLTINLGFVIQGNKADELPEQMLGAVCLNQVDPLLAPAYPPIRDDVLSVVVSDDDAGSLTSAEG